MDDQRQPDDRFAMIRAALVELGLAPADDRQAQARGALRVLELEREIARGLHPEFAQTIEAEARRLLA